MREDLLQSYLKERQSIKEEFDSSIEDLKKVIKKAKASTNNDQSFGQAMVDLKQGQQDFETCFKSGWIFRKYLNQEITGNVDGSLKVHKKFLNSANNLSDVEFNALVSRLRQIYADSSNGSLYITEMVESVAGDDKKFGLNHYVNEIVTGDAFKDKFSHLKKDGKIRVLIPYKLAENDFTLLKCDIYDQEKEGGKFLGEIKVIDPLGRQQVKIHKSLKEISVPFFKLEIGKKSLISRVKDGVQGGVLDGSGGLYLLKLIEAFSSVNMDDKSLLKTLSDSSYSYESLRDSYVRFLNPWCLYVAQLRMYRPIFEESKRVINDCDNRIAILKQSKSAMLEECRKLKRRAESIAGENILLRREKINNDLQAKIKRISSINKQIATKQETQIKERGLLGTLVEVSERFLNGLMTVETMREKVRRARFFLQLSNVKGEGQVHVEKDGNEELNMSSILPIVNEDVESHKFADNEGQIDNELVDFFERDDELLEIFENDDDEADKELLEFCNDYQRCDDRRKYAHAFNAFVENFPNDAKYDFITTLGWVWDYIQANENLEHSQQKQICKIKLKKARDIIVGHYECENNLSDIDEDMAFNLVSWCGARASELRSFYMEEAFFPEDYEGKEDGPIGEALRVKEEVMSEQKAIDRVSAEIYADIQGFLEVRQREQAEYANIPNQNSESWVDSQEQEKDDGSVQKSVSVRDC